MTQAVEMDVRVIAKTSEKLGLNHYREGTWDRLDGQDKQKCRVTTIVAVYAARYASVAVMRPFRLSSLESCPSNDPKHLCGIDSDPASRSFW